MPLLLKDMTFAHEGNKTSLDGLVNFEKMHMMAQTMRTIRFCRSRHLGKCFSFYLIYLTFLTHFPVNFLLLPLSEMPAAMLSSEIQSKMHLQLGFIFFVLFLCISVVLDPPTPKSETEVRSYISCFRVIENQRQLTIMSQKIEPPRKQ